MCVVWWQRVPKDILERGYDRGQEFFLQDHQKGKLSGIETLSTAKERQWAASGVERLVGDGSADTGRVLRKMHGDGLRLDSEAIRGAKGKKQKAEVDPDRLEALPLNSRVMEVKDVCDMYVCCVGVLVGPLP